ncbi:sugar phosphate nucleotidyltransferase [Desulfatitalea sp. M08but]|uniref:Sugar phosphate nucleotidyltransferase n=1 Tax=Desulfatitalea alkaliphila TaxID=2929485 RepID=A0AA41UM96_9BACT|nr:sugar phosphate nucleotidyltransferase [Desulfatitalea alkaliphila]
MLHPICGVPMIRYVVDTAATVAGNNVVVVVGHQAERVKQVVAETVSAHFALQERQLGTGHAVMCALPSIPDDVAQVVVLCGDVPLIRPGTIEQLVADHCRQRRDVTLLAVRLSNPKGYGRLIFDAGGGLTAIVEEADADEVQKAINIVNAGIYVIRRDFLESVLPRLGRDNKQNEIYLTDIVGLGYRDQRPIGAVIVSDSSEILGVNSRDDLQIVEKIMNMRGSGKDLDFS